MSRKILCMLLLVVMLLPAIVACNTSDSTETQPTETTTETADPSVTADTQTPETSAEETPEPEKTPLPSYSTLRGTKYMPPVDNQGNIGSCSAESVTYMQFTIAVAQYVNNVLGNEEWDPSSGNKNYIFSPKFTFVFSGAGTGYSYEILTDSGCLPLSQSSFKKNGTSSVMNDPQSRSWDCLNSGQLAQALNYRLSNYKEIDFDMFNYDFKTEAGQKHIEKIKDAINRGNAVSVCGWSGFWQYTKINGLGNLGKIGNEAIWSGVKVSDSTEDGNHAVALVGYDDDITCTIGGVKMKGAFLMINSWGSWKDNGYVWIMYDALNKVSEYPELAEEGYYSNRLAFYSVDKPGEARTKMPFGTKDNMQLIYTQTESKFTVEGTEYSVYTITDKVNGYYLGSETGVEWKEGYDESCRWVLIPYSDYSKWNGLTFTKEGLYKEQNYKNSFLICSVSKYTDITSSCFITAGASNSSSIGRVMQFTACKMNNIQTSAFMISSYNSDAGTFTGSLKLHIPYTGGEYERTGVLYRTSFVYWDEDVAISSPNLIVEVELEAVKRESIKVTLYRSDLEGNMVSRIPQIIHNNIISTTSMGASSGETRFDGKESDGTYCRGYLSFGYNVTANLGSNYEYGNLLWGVNVTGNILGVKILGLKLMLLDGTVLSEVKVNEQDQYLGKGESHSYIFDIGEKLLHCTTASGSSAVLYNEGFEKYVNFKAAKILLGDEKKDDATLKFIENPNGTVKIYDKDESWLFDISGKKIEEGVAVKLNKPSTSRLTQDWIIESIDDGVYVIKLAEDPSYMISYDKSTGYLCLTQKKDSEGLYKWSATSDVVLDFSAKAEKTGDNVRITGSVPDDYISGDITVKITQADGNYFSSPITVTPEDGKYEISTALPDGDYLITPCYNGKIYGFQYIYTVK